MIHPVSHASITALHVTMQCYQPLVDRLRCGSQWQPFEKRAGAEENETLESGAT